MHFTTPWSPSEVEPEAKQKAPLHQCTCVHPTSCTEAVSICRGSQLYTSAPTPDLFECQLLPRSSTSITIPQTCFYISFGAPGAQTPCCNVAEARPLRGFPEPCRLPPSLPLGLCGGAHTASIEWTAANHQLDQECFLKRAEARGLPSTSIPSHRALWSTCTQHPLEAQSFSPFHFSICW